MIQNSSSMDRPVAAAGGLLTRGRLLLGGAVLLLLVGAIVLFPSLHRWSASERAVDATTLTTAVVTRGDLVRDVSVQGRVVAALHPTLFSPAQGIVSLRTQAGRVVKQGDVLAIIESSELRSAYDQANAQLLSLQSDAARQRILSNQTETRARQQAELARVRLEAAKRVLARDQRTFAEGLTNKLDYEKSQDDVRIAQLELDQATREISLGRENGDFDTKSRELQARRQQSAAEELQRKVNDLTIRAPFDGLVATVAVSDRDAVAPNQAVVSVVNLSSLELELAVPEDFAGDVRIGTPVTINSGGHEYPGHVTSISPEVVGNEVIGRAVPDQGWPEGLKQNQRVTTRLVFESKKNVLKVPRGGFVESGGGHSAYVVDSGMATRRPISIGAVSVSEVEITGGLKEGERIVISDTSPFNDAKRVLLR